jgi:hypothetical protein
VARPFTWVIRLAAGGAVGLASLAAQQRSETPLRWPEVNGAVPLVPRLDFRSSPRFSIGSAAGADYTLFDGVTGAVRTEDGGVAIGDAGNGRVVFFDRAGRFVRSVGRSGDGPLEFRRLGRGIGGPLQRRAESRRAQAGADAARGDQTPATASP